jgi:hypothetical protein
MGREVLDFGMYCGSFDNVPDCLWRYSFAPHFVESIERAEHRTLAETARCGPFIDGALRPDRYRDGTDVFPFVDQIFDNLMVLANLEIFFPQADEFSAPEALTTCWE